MALSWTSGRLELCMTSAGRERGERLLPKRPPDLRGSGPPPRAGAPGARLWAPPHEPTCSGGDGALPPPLSRPSNLPRGKPGSVLGHCLPLAGRGQSPAPDSAPPPRLCTAPAALSRSLYP